MTVLVLLCAFSMIAGFVDAAVGGGGLIQLPAALILLPGVPVPTVLGTNKFASFFGTSFAVQRYARHVKLDWSTVLPAALAGSRAVSLLDPALLRPLILALLVVVATYVLLVKDLGLIHAPKHAPAQSTAVRNPHWRSSRILRRLLRTGDGQLSHLRLRRNLRFRFPLRVRVR